MRQASFILALIFAVNFSGLAQVVRKGMKLTKPPMPVEAKALYSIEPMTGKWQEISRMSGNETQDFTDTLLLDIKNGKGTVKDATSMSMAMTGAAMIDAPDILDIGGYGYKIKDLSESTLVLQDDDYVHRLKKVSSFYLENVGKDSITQANYFVPVNADMELLKGKWNVYRRQAAPGFITENTVLVKSFSILSGAGNTGSGEIVTFNSGTNISENFPCVITLVGDGQLKVTSMKGDMIFNIYKADGKELVFGDEKGVMSYANK